MLYFGIDWVRIIISFASGMSRTAVSEFAFAHSLAGFQRVEASDAS